jgi:hypothetical protein
MNASQLLLWVEQPETHRKIAGDYQGSYALGVREDPPAFVLRVEPADVASFPTQVTIDGDTVPVIVHGNFVPPRADVRMPDPGGADGTELHLGVRRACAS